MQFIYAFCADAIEYLSDYYVKIILNSRTNLFIFWHDLYMVLLCTHLGKWNTLYICLYIHIYLYLYYRVLLARTFKFKFNL